jgi:hypothetical protein
MYEYMRVLYHKTYRSLAIIVLAPNEQRTEIKLVRVYSRVE